MGKKDSAKLQFYADADAVDEFTEFYRKLGMSQREAGSRIFAWFNQQSPLIRQHILQPMPEEVAPDIARIILERMAEQERQIEARATQPASVAHVAAAEGLDAQTPQRLTAHGSETAVSAQRSSYQD